MNRISALITSVLVFAALAAQPAHAAAFDPQFTITKIVGAVTVKLPNAKQFTDATAGLAYPYGTTISTDRKASAVLSFSEGNICRIAAKTTVVVTADTKNELLKVMNLAEGKLDMEMDKMVKGQQLQIETAAAVCGITGTQLSIESTHERNVNAMIVAVHKVGSSVDVGNEFFRITNVVENQELVVSVTDKRDYIRIRIIRGAMKVFLNDETASKEIGVDTGSLVKIFVKEFADYYQVTALVYASDQPGAPLAGTVSMRKKKETAPPTGKPTETTTKPPETTTKPPESKTDQNKEAPPVIEKNRRFPRSSSSSSTTIPDTTPKGLR